MVNKPVTAETVPTNKFDLEEKLVIVDTKTLSTLFAEENGADAVALYFFYYNTAKRQATNQIRATEAFCRAGLRWGVKRFRDAQEVLRRLNLVEVLKGSAKWYIRLGYVKSNSAKNSLVDPVLNSAKKQLVAFGTQMLSKGNNINALSTVTNVTDDAPPKRGAPCPLNGSFWKGKYPKGHLECVEYINSFKFVNKAKQFRFLHQMLRAGLDFSDIDKLISRVEKKPYYKENGYDFATLASEADRSANAYT